MKAHIEAKAAWDAGAIEAEMKPALEHIRNAQWYWDYAAAGHGSSFHSPVEVSRIIGLSMNESTQARILIARTLAMHGRNIEIPYPDITTKEKAQQLIGLPIDQLRKEKEEWIKSVLPEWDKKAAERESKWSGIEK